MDLQNSQTDEIYASCHICQCSALFRTFKCGNTRNRKSHQICWIILSVIEAIASEEKVKIQTLILQGRAIGPTLVAGSNSIGADTIMLIPENPGSTDSAFDKTSKYVMTHSKCNTLIWSSNKRLDGKISS